VKNTVIIDAGPLIALFDGSDKYHRIVIDFLRNFSGRLITTLPVITEATHLLDFDVKAQIDLLKWIELDGVSIFQISAMHIKKMVPLIEKYSDRPMDFADASIVILADELNINDIISIDSDFEIYRYKSKKRFNNLLTRI